MSKSPPSLDDYLKNYPENQQNIVAIDKYNYPIFAVDA